MNDTAAPLHTSARSADASRVTAWSLIKPYWVSEERWSAIGLLLLVIALNMAIVYINVRLNAWNREFYDALAAKNWNVFIHSMLEFSYLAFAYIFIVTTRIWFRQLLEIRWRTWLTTRFVERWLSDHAFYRIERDRLADNPDQRISDDLESLASTTLALSLDLLSTVVTLFSFVFILWHIAGALTFTVSGTVVTIPGYMVWAAALYALAGSFVIQRFGKPLVAINYQKQRVEANFRFFLVRVRENAEQIALYGGADAERKQARTIFQTIYDNWRGIMTYTKRLTIVNAVYGQLANIFPFFVAAPRYFSGAYPIGTLFQISDAFGTVSESFSWFINSFSTLAGWRATVNRLREFVRSIDEQHTREALSPATEHGGINRHLTDTQSLRTDRLVLALPDGTVLARVGEIGIDPGARVLVRGASGSGKSTLLRALAGLWPFGDGSIDIPVSAKLLFVPQVSYIPIGPLHAALAYPSQATAFTDDACRAALRMVKLDDYVDRLDEDAHWTRRLSPGEQQRLAFARVLLQKPDFVFLDEATSALDAPTERHVYEALLRELPGTAIVSVAHRDSLDVYHRDTILITREQVAAAA
ncbi:ABC transporter ATP-binding protein/permease [Pararobbsia silviterrae]|uniref:ABC transporter ATP-binding protein/permease n=1 Tax=Pararobbsia silviterrae TaxID=1792498 RepID=A0A494X7Y1_9BURK|nr:ABC transporter ATP-binding protein/permease [Pararobbsia silviterrae]RKP45721.1 ABC transporter ATP-binding protein/permease [Pararobbsia silviterrae]